MKKIKSVIIDDEKLGRQLIREYLERHPDIVVAAECADARQALRAVARHKPDLLFLDIQMPEINGFDLLEMMDEIPLVVFSTAYDRYALRAFEVRAVDYLLKPYDQERFDEAVGRVKGLWREGKNDSGSVKGLLSQVRRDQPCLERLLVKKSGKIIILGVQDIQWIEAEGDYAHLHTKEGSYLVLQTMGSLQSRLDPGRFVRVHRSAIVQLDAVQEIVPWSKGKWKVRLKNGKEVLISRAGAGRLKTFML